MNCVVKEPDESLNYHHLRYFWLVVREGSVVAAAKRLHVSQPAISGQIGELERALGRRLFDRRGRRLELTEQGKLVYDYAHQIFGLGQELVAAIQRHDRALRKVLAVGCVESLPSMVVETVLQSLAGPSQHLHFVCYTKKHSELVGDLAAGRLDILISDSPISLQAGGYVSTRQIGESDIVLLAGTTLATQIERGFPQSLNGAPMILPTPDHPMRHLIDRWLISHALRPEIVGEVGNADLLLRVAPSMAVFPAHAACKQAIMTQCGVVPLGSMGLSLPVHVAVAHNAARLDQLGLHL